MKNSTDRFGKIFAGFLSRLAVCGVIACVNAAFAQPVVTYAFNGQITQTIGYNAFPGVGPGSLIQGMFTIDYGATDSNANVTQGRYTSALVALSGMIGSHSFASVPDSGNNVVTFDSTVPLYAADYVDVYVRGGGSFDNLTLGFTDLQSVTLTSDALPTTAAVFDAFPGMSLRTGQSQGIGIYHFTGSVTIVPEPAILPAIAGSLFWLCLRRRAARGHAATSAQR
jgi:hypothetical protein